MSSAKPRDVEPRLIQSPKTHRAKRPSSTPTKRETSVRSTGTTGTDRKSSHGPSRKASTAAAKVAQVEPDRNLTAADAEEGTDAFKNRISEITSFRVVSRVRPFIAEELAEMKGSERRSVVEMKDTTTILLDPKENWGPKAQFDFDASFWSIPPGHGLIHTFQDTKRKDYATQKVVYDYVAKDLVPHIFNGFNSCVLSYGQTGSGKTYTMMGLYDPKASCGGDGEEGIIPRVSNDLFVLLRQRLLEEQEKPPRDRTKYRVEVSFVEIYMERVRDLLDPALKNTRGNEKLQDARIRQDPYSGPFVEGVTKYSVENWEQCCLLLERGSQHRTTSVTAVHNQSSRSHANFQITLVQETVKKATVRGGRPTTKTQAGRINLVDLAGSERGGFQEYVKESAAINTSLLALRRVIDNLTERQNMLIEQARAEITGGNFQERPLPQVPYRDSVLTWLLSDSFGGNARTTMVATLSPLVKNYGDTLATLQWSSKARNLVTLVKMNDQTVFDGLVNHTGQLGQAAQIQRGNLDSLHVTLKAKQEAAEKIEKDTAALQKSLNKLREQINRVRRDRAAIIIQRSMRRYLFSRQFAGYEENHRQLSEMVKNGQVDMTSLMATRDAALLGEQEAQGRLKAAEQETDAIASECGAFEANRPAFNQRKAEAQERYERIREHLHADELEERHKAEIEQVVAATRANIESTKAERAERQKNMEKMQDKVEKSKLPGWHERIEKDKADIAGLRRKRDELKIRRDDALRGLEAVRARSATSSKKSRNFMKN